MSISWKAVGITVAGSLAVAAWTFWVVVGLAGLPMALWVVTTTIGGWLYGLALARAGISIVKE